MTTDTHENNEINRTEAARLLGVGANAVKDYPIPFRQYRTRGKAIYKRSDVLAFMESSSHKPKQMKHNI